MEKKIDYSSLYECIDQFNEIGREHHFTEGGIDIQRDLIKPIENGEDKWVVLERASEKVWAFYEENEYGIRTQGLVGKRRLDKQELGIWRCGIYETVRFDIDETHKSLKEYLPKRLAHFFSMLKEKELLNTLIELGYKAEKASEYDDKAKKIDLYLTIDNIKYAVRVFKNSSYAIECAKVKIANCKVKIKEPIIEFRFDENRNPKNSEHVKNWIKELPV